MSDHPVLVLTRVYEPLNICRVRRAITLIYTHKAEMLENGYGFIHSAESDFPIPSVIKLESLVRRPARIERRLNRFEIFRRDNYTCQYCGRQLKALTLDHVIPRSRNGAHTWENIVSACGHCNRKKAGRTPAEAGMKLLHQPVKPKFNGGFYLPSRYRQIRDEWKKYLPAAASG
jgi:5-methylcytosine-specific restriction endonuclease McrA